MDIATDNGLAVPVGGFRPDAGGLGHPEGPFLVLPLLGPSNFRDTAGFAADAYGDPINLWAGNTDHDLRSRCVGASSAGSIPGPA